MQGRGGRVHRDTTPIIRCTVCDGIARDIVVSVIVRTTTTTTTTRRLFGSRLPSSSRVTSVQDQAVSCNPSGRHGWRTRQRRCAALGPPPQGGGRLRSWLRHERMTVAMELAAATHHSSPKGGWPGATHDALRGQTTATRAAERCGHSPAAHLGAAPGMQILDAPVPQLVDQLVTALSHVDSFVPEQVIEVP